MTRPDLKPFEFTEAEQVQFSSVFEVVHEDVTLPDAVSQAKSSPEASGCYFWVLRSELRLYKIYIGRTANLRRRMVDYANPFQIHAPNDYKLRFFQEYCREFFPYSQLDLYFLRIPSGEVKNRETELVRMFAPLINQRMVSTTSQRELIYRAFSEYYTEIFQAKLQPKAE